MSSRSSFMPALAIALALASLAAFVWRNQHGFYQTPIDFLIFIHADERFHQTGQLYQRAADYAGKYHPTAAIYKFPPAFELMIEPLLRLPPAWNAQMFTRLLLTSMYVVSLLILFFHLKKQLALKKEVLLYFASLLTVIACNFMPFFECIRWLLAEIPLLLLFTLAFLLARKTMLPSLLSGALMAFAACVKIYPAFLFIYQLRRHFSAALAGFLIGAVLTTLAALYCFGMAEHAFYLHNILPVLLKEPVVDKWVNLNIENFLFMSGQIPEVTGHIFRIVRFVMIALLLVMLAIPVANEEKKGFLLYCLCITTMFFCFPNYWPQYQIFLILPIAGLLAYSLKGAQHFRLLLLLLVTAMLFIPDQLWRSVLDWDLARQGVDLEMVGKEEYLNGTGTTLLHYSLPTWLLYYGYACRALVPFALWFLLVLQLLQADRKSA